MHLLWTKRSADDLASEGAAAIAGRANLLWRSESGSWLTSKGDGNTTSALVDALAEFDGDGVAPAVRLALATIQEFHQTTRVSAETFARAAVLLDEGRAEDRSTRPMVIDGRAREVNQSA